jgi:hypothetical protein
MRTLPFITCLLLASSIAGATPRRPAPMPDVGERKLRAQRLVVEARALFDRGDFEGAIVKFEEAYRFFPVAKMLYNIGITYDALRRDDRAACALEQFVAEVPEADPSLRADAITRVDRLQSRIGRIEVRAPEGVLLFVDGDERGAAPPRVPLCATPGAHRVAALSTGAAPVGLDLTVVAGGTQVVALDPLKGRAHLGPELSAPSVKPPMGIPDPTPPAKGPEPRPAWKSPWLWTVVGVVVVGAAVTGVVLATRPNANPPPADFGPVMVFK